MDIDSQENTEEKKRKKKESLEKHEEERGKYAKIVEAQINMKLIGMR